MTNDHDPGSDDPGTDGPSRVARWGPMAVILTALAVVAAIVMFVEPIDTNQSASSAAAIFCVIRTSRLTPSDMFPARTITA